MHEARTKGDWLINASKNDDPNDKKFIKRRQEGNKIYRTLLHYSLIEYFDQYMRDLKKPDNNFNDLRKKFARKLDHLYGFDGQDDKNNFDWWNE